MNNYVFNVEERDGDDIDLIGLDYQIEDGASSDYDVLFLTEDEEDNVTGGSKKCHDYRAIKYKYVNRSYHDTTYKCKICGRKKVVRQRHNVGAGRYNRIGKCSLCNGSPVK